MTREEAIERFNGIINAMSISIAQSKFYPSKAELDELCDMAIEALSDELSDYACWLESIIVTDEPCWLCEDSIDDEWCHKNCGTKTSIQAECLRHFFKVLSAEEYEDYEHATLVDIKEPLKKLSAEPSVSIQPKTIANNCDLISRSDAIEAVRKCKVQDIRFGNVTSNMMLVQQGEVIVALLALPSAEAVSRESLKNLKFVAIKGDKTEEAYRQGWNGAIECIIENVLSAKTIQGEWIFNTDENNCKSWNICSVCGYSIFHTTHFCPNCGAKMKGGAE